MVPQWRHLQLRKEDGDGQMSELGWRLQLKLVVVDVDDVADGASLAGGRAGAGATVVEIGAEDDVAGKYL